MKVISDIGKIKPSGKNTYLAIGVFDGVHRGHEFLIRQAVRAAQNSDGQSVVMTFYPHPQKVLHPNFGLQYLLPLQRRLELIRNIGVDMCVVVPFTKKFSKLTPLRFLQTFVGRPFRPRKIFIGENFRFGRARRGGVDLLKKSGKKFEFQVQTIAPVKIRRRIVSSSLIRKLIAKGNIALASEMLGRPVSVFGRVVKGDGRGRQLGFPTANIRPYEQIIPPRGVYATWVIVGKKVFGAMTNIGIRPSFDNKKLLTIETHIFRFNRNVYGRELEIRFCRKIRNEKKFSSPNLLISQLKKDKHTALKHLSGSSSK